MTLTLFQGHIRVRIIDKKLLSRFLSITIHIKKIKHSMICVTGVYLRGVSDTFSPVLHLNVHQLSVSSSCIDWRTSNRQVANVLSAANEQFYWLKKLLTSWKPHFSLTVIIPLHISYEIAISVATGWDEHLRAFLVLWKLSWRVRHIMLSLVIILLIFYVVIIMISFIILVNIIDIVTIIFVIIIIIGYRFLLCFIEKQN